MNEFEISDIIKSYDQYILPQIKKCKEACANHIKINGTPQDISLLPSGFIDESKTRDYQELPRSKKHLKIQQNIQKYNEAKKKMRDSNLAENALLDLEDGEIEDDSDTDADSDDNGDAILIPQKRRRSRKSK